MSSILNSTLTNWTRTRSIYWFRIFLEIKLMRFAHL